MSIPTSLTCLASLRASLASGSLAIYQGFSPFPKLPFLLSQCQEIQLRKSLKGVAQMNSSGSNRPFLRPLSLWMCFCLKLKRVHLDSMETASIAPIRPQRGIALQNAKKQRQLLSVDPYPWKKMRWVAEESQEELMSRGLSSRNTPASTSSKYPNQGYSTWFILP